VSKTILLAEDEPHIVESLTFLLTREGFSVTAEPDGAAVLARIIAAPPDLLILDIMLPGMSGLEILRRARQTPGGARLPVLMLSAKGQRQDRETAEALGADAFISKPFSNAEVIAEARRLAG